MGSLTALHPWAPLAPSQVYYTLRGLDGCRRNLQDLPLGMATLPAPASPQLYLQVEVVSPLPDDFVLRSGVPDLILVDVVTPWRVSILVERHGSPSDAWKRGRAQHPQHGVPWVMVSKGALL